MEHGRWRRWVWWCGPVTPEEPRRTGLNYAAAGAVAAVVFWDPVIASKWPAAQVISLVVLALGAGWCGWRTPSGRTAILGGFFSGLAAAMVLSAVGLLHPKGFDSPLAGAACGAAPLAIVAAICGAVGAFVRQAIDPTQLVF